MGPLQELLAVDHRRAFEFFFTRLRDVTEPGVGRDELLYNASVLAHYAQVSTGDAVSPAPTGLDDVFDAFASETPIVDADVLEVIGTHCLLLVGFFGDQMRRRHNLSWYSQLGAGFFHRAARHQPSPRKARLMDTMGRDFGRWRQRHERLSRDLRDTPFLLTVKVPDRPF